MSRRTSVLLDSIDKPSIIAVVGSLQLTIRRLLSLLAFIKLLLNHPKSSYEEVSSTLIADPLLLLTVCIVVSPTQLTMSKFSKK